MIRTVLVNVVLALTVLSILTVQNAGIASARPAHALHGSSDRYLLKVARRDFRLQHDRMAKKALSELLTSHKRSILRGPALLLLARIHARETLKKGVKNFRAPLAFFERAENVPPLGWDKGEVLYRKGRYLILQRFGAEGRGILEQVLSRYPDGPWAVRALLAISDSWRSRGSLRRAEKMLANAGSRLSRTSPLSDRIRYQYLRGHIQLDRGDLTGSEESLIAALSLSKSYPYSHPWTLFLLARAAYAFNHNKRSDELFRRFIRLFPDDSRSGEAEYYMARISGRLGYPMHERARLREVVSDNPGTSASHLARIALMKLVFFGPKDGRPSRDLPEALSRSIRKLGQIVSVERNARISGEAALLRARLLERSGDWEKAFRGVSRLEGRVDPVSRLGKRVQGFEKELILDRIAALSRPLHPNQILALYNSYSYLLPAPEDPSAGDLFLSIAKASRTKGNKKAGWKYLGDVLADSKDSAILGRASDLKYRWLVEDGMTSGALKWAVSLSRNGSLLPETRRGWFVKALSLARKMKEPDTERKILSDWTASGLTLDNPGETFARLGLLDLGSGHHEKGRSELLRSLPDLEGRRKDTPLLAKVLFHLGQEAFLEGNRTDARRYWKEMLDCCPSESRGGWVTYQMGQMAFSEGHVKEAYDWFQKTVKLYPHDEVARVARLKIQAMALEKKDGDP